jgi:hypothetical protein
MNIKSTSMDAKLPSDSAVGPKAEYKENIPEGFVEILPESSSEFASLPNFGRLRVLESVEPLPSVKTDGPWIIDDDGDYVRKGAVVALRVDRYEHGYKVVAVTERLVFTIARCKLSTSVEELRQAVARAVAG